VEVAMAIGHNSRAMRSADLLIGRSAGHTVLSCAWRAGDAHSARAASRAGRLMKGETTGRSRLVFPISIALLGQAAIPSNFTFQPFA
jgi:hypothetical protein